MSQIATRKVTTVRRLNVPEAIDYLLNAHGVRITGSALAQLRFERTGPSYCRIQHRVYYSPQDIDRWIAKKVAAFSDSRRRASRPRL